jgi:2-methylaconitate cis-trans-isomerase PrpF
VAQGICVRTAVWQVEHGRRPNGVGHFAIERGLVAVAGEAMPVRIRLANTGARVVETV